MRKRIMSALLVLALCLSLAPTAALADEPAEAPESALTEETALPEDGTTEETEPEEPVYAELVELPPIETSAWPGISLWSLTNGQVDLADGNHEKWIDRIDVPDYAKDFYAALENGAQDGGVLIRLVARRMQFTKVFNIMAAEVRLAII